ncbi:helix-turn-helix transcriptional regulator [Solwaraspora sp. WMMD937]|uniref:helix-turn-helix domain-containing protein n=1 Tax=Solwaraspora sp. WMMD937 TaxID=3016090 RepID=UPI00249A9291|nr:helix-turn-helix transcriptional regulator [Solwaraspora sp. WMMD937]WFE21583.1 helix-turn-helix transcriptional regulator [Solwaraspora sp. WMMD937]
MIKLPPEVLDRADVRQALRAGDWATVLQVVTAEARVSQTEIAQAVGISQPHVSRLLSGRSRDPGLRTVRALCDGLGIPRSLAGLLSEQEDDTNRRQFVAAAAAATGVTLIGTAAGDVPLESRDDEQLLTIPSTTYRRLEQRLPARSLLPPVSAHLALTRQLASRNERSPAHTRQLYSVLSETAGLTAWLYVDVDDQAGARRHYKLAVHAAERSGHPLLLAYMRASLGQFAANCGDAHDAIRLVASARHALPRSAPTISTIWIDAIESLALAEAGDKKAIFLLGQADDRLAKSRNDEPIWPWIFRFDHQKLASFRAQVASKLNQPSAASQALSIAASGPAQSPKAKALSDVLQAEILAKSGHLDEACNIACQAFDAGKKYESEKILQSVARFRKNLGGQTGKLTLSLDERLYSRYQEDR